MYDRNYEDLAGMSFDKASLLVNQSGPPTTIECPKRVFDDIPESVVTKV